ncbi:hypothetical protein EPO56_00330 [Patescibacteria group bacterium]|nr:MAG: hypothetical protein EPO56_00330 [Patescibacteria group bacterium]
MSLDSKSVLVGLLRQSEKYLKTDMVYLASGGFWLVVSQIVSSLSSLALAVAFANLVSPETYGTYKYLLSLAGLMSLFSLPGINTALLRATAQGRGSTIHTLTRSRILYACLGSVVALIGSIYYFANVNTLLSIALLIIAATLPLFDTLTSYLFYFVGKRRFDLRTKYYALTQIVSTLVLIATIFLTDNLILILIAYFVPLICIRGALYWLVARTIPRTALKDEVAEVKQYGIHLTVMQILGTIANEVDKILIWKFLGPVQVAVYTLALAIPEQIRGPLKGIGELAFPKFAEQTPEQIRRNLPALFRKLALYAFALFGISILYMLAAPYIFQLFFPQYMESASYSQWFALSMVAGVASIPITILAAQKKTSLQYAIYTIQPVITIGFLIILVPLYGIMGAIIALLLSRFITLAIYLGSLFTLR